jgi:hypothetical protein
MVVVLHLGDEVVEEVATACGVASPEQRRVASGSEPAREAVEAMGGALGRVSCRAHPARG